jgi:hypothetical protein
MKTLSIQDYSCSKCGNRITKAMPTDRVLPVRIFRDCCERLAIYIMCDAVYGESRPDLCTS